MSFFFFPFLFPFSLLCVVFVFLADMFFARLDDLIEVLENGFVGQVGQGDEEPDTRAQAEAALRRS